MLNSIIGVVCAWLFACFTLASDEQTLNITWVSFINILFVRLAIGLLEAHSKVNTTVPMIYLV